MRRVILLTLLLALAIGNVVPVSATLALDARIAGLPELRIRLTEERIEAPAEVAAGRTLVIEEHEGPLAGHAFIFRVPDDVSDEALADALSTSTTLAEGTETPEWFWQADFVGNGDRAKTDRPAVGVVDLKPGRYVIGDPYMAPTGFARFDAVGDTVGDAPAAAPLAADASVEIFEMNFTIPDEVAAGQQLWQITNTGAMLHEIALFPVPSGATPEQVIAAVEAGGEAAFGAEMTPEMRAAVDAIGSEWTGWTLELAGGLGVLSPQGVAWAQFDLAPGTYAAVCFVPLPDGTPHLMIGMSKVFTVNPVTD